MADVSRRSETNLPALSLGWIHKPADSCKDHAELRIVLLLESHQFLRQLFVAQQHLAELDERTHDRDADLDGAMAAKHGGEHRDALLGEGVWGEPDFGEGLGRGRFCGHIL